MRRASVIAIVALAVPMIGTAQGKTVSATLEVPLESSVGDAIDAIVTVTTPASEDAAVPDQSFGTFEVLEKKMTEALSQDGQTRTFTFELKLLNFEAGVHTLGPIKVRVATQDGALRYIQTDAKTIEVDSLLANEPNPTLKPATEPVVVVQDDFLLLWILGALAAMLLGAVLAWFLMRWWRKRERPEAEAPPPPPPWETALGELRVLDHKRLQMIGGGKTEQWVDAVSDTVRNYLGQRFGFHGLESTTDEIAQELSQTRDLKIEPTEAVQFLSQCDLVKFARVSIAEETSRQLMTDAFTMVKRTTATDPGTQAAPATQAATGAGPQ